jgi:hypothetical protein
MKVSPGCNSARNTDWFAWLPEFGCTFAVEEPGDALDREAFGHIDELAAAIIAPAGIALGVFVGQNRALRFEHRFRDDIFRCDQLDFMSLAAEFQLDRLGDFGIGIGETCREKRI